MTPLWVDENNWLIFLDLRNDKTVYILTKLPFIIKITKIIIHERSSVEHNVHYYDIVLTQTIVF